MHSASLCAYTQTLPMDTLLAVYPTARKVEDVLKRASQVRGCLLGHHITTFPQLTEALWRESDAALILLGAVGETVALGEAIARMRGRHGYILGGPGFMTHLRVVIRQLKSASLSASDLQQASAALSGPAGELITRLADIFAEYDKVLLEAGVADTHDRERLVLEQLHRMEESGRRPRLLAGVVRLLVAEVYDPSLLQFMMVAALIRMIGEADLTIQAESHEVSVGRLAELTWNRFVAEESIADNVLPHFVRRGGRDGRLGFILTHLFDKQHHELPEPPPEDGTVRIIACPDVSREAGEVARSIRRILAGPNPVALERIAVVGRDLSSYADHLESAFRRYQIPLTLVSPKLLSTTPQARAVRELLRIPIHEYPREQLVALCNSGFFRLDAAAYSELPAQAGYIDRSTRPLPECVERLRGQLTDAVPNSPNSSEASIRNQALRRKLERLVRGAAAWNKLLEWLESLEATATVTEHVANLLQVLDRLGFDSPTNTLADSIAVAVGTIKATLDALAGAASIMTPHRRITLSEFSTMVGRLFDETLVNDTRRGGTAGVCAMPVLEARGLDFDLVFIVGLNDGVFPSYHSEDALIPDELIRQLNRPLRDCLRRRWGRFAPDAPGPILRTRYDHNAEEPFLFFLALSMAERNVVLSYSTTDAKGAPLPESPFITEVRRILRATDKEPLKSEHVPPVEHCFTRDDFLNRAAADSLLADPALGADERIKSIVRRTAVEHGREAYFALPTREELFALRVREPGAKQLWMGIDLSPDEEKFARANCFDGRIEPTQSLRQFFESPDGSTRQWSATQLNELAACGFKFFSKRILRLIDPEEPDYELTALESGDRVHRILRQVFERAVSGDSTAFRAAAACILNEVHQQARLEVRDEAFFELEWESISAMVNEIVEYEITRLARDERPSETRLEYPFDLALTRGSDASRAIKLAGQIDRLELYRERSFIQKLKIIDYKSSRALKKYSSLLEPGYFASHDLQMAVYALAALEKFRTEMSAGAGIEASYIALKNYAKESTSQPIPLDLLTSEPEKNSARVRTVAERLFELVDSAATGHFDVDPLKCDQFCSYRSICRFRKPLSRS
jgi:RecB family exonuclease